MYQILVTIALGLISYVVVGKLILTWAKPDEWTFANGDKVFSDPKVRIQEGAGAILWPLILLLWVLRKIRPR